MNSWIENFITLKLGLNAVMCCEDSGNNYKNTELVESIINAVLLAFIFMRISCSFNFHSLVGFQFFTQLCWGAQRVFLTLHIIKNICRKTGLAVAKKRLYYYHGYLVNHFPFTGSWNGSTSMGNAMQIFDREVLRRCRFQDFVIK